MSEAEAPLPAAAAAPLARAQSDEPLPVEADHTLLHHLGLPFYYRHTPGPLLRRGIFWFSFLGFILLLIFNVIAMPFPKDSILYTLRAMIYGRVPPYQTFEEASAALASQCFAIATVLSCIVAPLYSCFSLSNERVLGTMEFLRLAPLSSTGIVMGKAFATTYVVHLISAALICFGIPLGLLGLAPPEHVAYAATCIVFHAAAMSALGAYLATQTMVFRGFGSVGLSLAIGFCAQVLPVACVREGREGGFAALLSPWSTLDLLFWRNGYVSPVELFHSSTCAFVYALAAQGVLFACLIHAASRKLDAPENTALRHRDYALLLGMIVLAALGVALNFDRKDPPYLAGKLWELGALVLLFGGFGVCLLALIDHPFRRERLLTDACERLAGRDDLRAGRRLGHAAFCVLMAAVNGIALLLFLNMSGALARVETLLTVAVSVLVLFVVLGAALLIEASALRFQTFLAQAATAAVALAILAGVTAVPIVHSGMVYSDWHSCAYYSEAYYQYEINKKRGLNFRNYDPTSQFNRMRQTDEYAEYVKDLPDLAAVRRQRELYAKAPIALMWKYAPMAVLAYPAVFALTLLLILWFRGRSYRRLIEEARRSLQRSSGDGSPA
ncbi:MAG: ABC transporter permease [Planctomycetota bacterium]|nr:ABC transporter permease [Planctomycetota bacterium]